jgi:minor histocompatibility antigen H13
MAEPGLLAQLFGKLAFIFAEIQPLIPQYLHILLSAIFPIYTASYASLSRPNSAAKQEKAKPGTIGHEDEDEEDDEYQRMEGLTPSDALLFPVFAGVTLTGLYFLIKWLEDPTILSKILNWHFAVMGLYGTLKLVSDSFRIIHAFIFPSHYLGGSGIWQVDQARRKSVLMATTGAEQRTRLSPLPGLLSLLPLPKTLHRFLWTIRSLSSPSKKLTFRFYIHRAVALKFHFDAFNLLGFFLATTVVLYFNLIEQPWWMNNLLAFSAAYSALQLMSPTTFKTGGMLLGGLFAYDIYMVFFTPMMITVAKNLDIPAKLLFPRPSDKSEAPGMPRQFSMLGLGDIVLPGLMIALALRFDLYLHYLRLQRKVPPTTEASTTDPSPTASKDTIIKVPYVPLSKHWSSRFWTSSSATLPHLTDGVFKKPYFTASLVGYVIGLMITLGVMHVWKHGQPALLYLVPGVLIALVLTARIRGELRQMWDFTEEEEEAEEETNGDTTKRSGNGNAVEHTKSPSVAVDATGANTRKGKQSKPGFFSPENIFTVSGDPRIRGNIILRQRDYHSTSESDESDEPGESQTQRKRRLSQAKVERVERAVRATADREWFHISISGYKPRKTGGKTKKEEGVTEKEKKKWVESKAVEKEKGLEAAHVAKKLRTA